MVQLAERLGVTKQSVWAAEHHTNGVRASTLEAWAKACGYELVMVPDGSDLAADEQALVADLVAALRAGVLDERRKKFLRMELREYLGDVATSKKAEAG